MVAQNNPPMIQNLTASPDYSNNTITINFELTSGALDEMKTSLLVSKDEGQTFEEITTNVSGDIGFPIMEGSKQVVWTAADFSFQHLIKVVVEDTQPIDIQELVNQVDTTRLWNDLTMLEGIRHRTAGAAHLAEVQTSIETHFANLNLEVEIQDIPEGNYVGKNIIGTLRGKSASKDFYVLDGHYDSVNDTPGADDNASAVAGVMEAARILSNYGFEHTIRFIGFDLEENGLKGSLAYIEKVNIAPDDFKGMINFEMIGYFDDAPNSQNYPGAFQASFPEAYALIEADDFRGNFIVNAGAINLTPLQDTFFSVAQTYVPELKVINLTATNFSDLPNQALLRSDHAPFWFTGRPAIMLTDGAEFRNPNYHTPNDLKETLDLEFMSNVVKAAIATLAELAGIKNSTSATVDVLANIDEVKCDFKMFPNPVNRQFQLNLEDCGLRDFQLRIFDVQGVEVLRKEIILEDGVFVTIDLQAFEAGIYLVSMQDGNKRLTSKIVVD